MLSTKNNLKKNMTKTQQLIQLLQQIDERTKAMLETVLSIQDDEARVDGDMASRNTLVLDDDDDDKDADDEDDDEEDNVDDDNVADDDEDADEDDKLDTKKAERFVVAKNKQGGNVFSEAQRKDIACFDLLKVPRSTTATVFGLAAKSLNALKLKFDGRDFDEKKFKQSLHDALSTCSPLSKVALEKVLALAEQVGAKADVKTPVKVSSNMPSTGWTSGAAAGGGGGGGGAASSSNAATAPSSASARTAHAAQLLPTPQKKARFEEPPTVDAFVEVPAEFKNLKVPVGVFDALVPAATASYYETSPNWFVWPDGSFKWKKDQRFSVSFN